MPPTMSVEQIEEADRVAELAASGDAAAREEIANRFISLVRGIAFKHRKKFSAISPDDAIEAGIDGFWRAIRSYDRSKGHFHKWAAWEIYHAILSEVRRSCRRSARVEVVDASDLDATAAVVQEAESPWFGPEDHERLYATLARWDREIPYQRLSLFVRLFSGLDPRGPLGYPQIGEIMNMDREQVRQIADRAYFLLCREFGTEAFSGLSFSEANAQA